MKLLFVLIFALPVNAIAQLSLAKIFSDNMVLQRDKPVHIWGKAVPGKNVSISFSKENKTVKVKPDSSWSVYLNPQKANVHPQLLIISSGNDKIVLENILIGDIWLCIGQSNMEWPMMKEMYFKEEIANCNQPRLRFYNPTYAGKNFFNAAFTDSVTQLLTKDNFYKGEWQSCDSITFKTISAVAYYFGKEVAAKTKVPIGLINLSIGGAPLESFISADVLKNSKQFSAKVNGDWLINEALPVWIRERGRQNIESAKNAPTDEYGKNHAFKAGFAYESGIQPMLPMPVKGILCYQGESNAQEMQRVNEYAALSKLMIDDYRKKWKQPQLPFYYVQLSSIDTIKYKGQLWPQFRDGQRRMLQLIPYSGMAVSSDIGFKDDVHPTNKKAVGKRLARWALNKTYRLNIIPSGPLPLNAKYENGKLLITFQYAGSRLKTSDSKPVKGFSLDGKNEVVAIAQGKTIVIAVKGKPEFIYYGWKPFSDANLINSEKLPASTFKCRVQ
jgi:sialate O-acetylesterase